MLANQTNLIFSKLKVVINQYWFWLVGALLIFGWNLNSYFVSDDFDFLRNMIGSGHPWWWWLANPQNAGVLFYRPLHNWYFLVHHWLFGLNPWPYHLTLIIGHSLAAYFLYCSLKSIKSLTPSLATVAALFFLVVPVHAESVAWISGGVSVLAGLPAIFSLYAWIRARQNNNLWWWAMSAAAWFVALLAKESVITWPLVLVIIDWLLLSSGTVKEKLFKFVKPVFYFLVPAVLYGILRFNSLDTLIGGYSTIVHTSLDLTTMVKMFTSSILIFFTIGQFKYWLTEQVYNYLPLAMSALAIILGLLLAAAKKYRAVIILGGLIFLVTLLPQLNLGINILDSQGERYLYLPTVGLAIVVASLLFSLTKRLKQLVFVVLLLASVSLLTVRLQHWQVAGSYSRKVIEQFAPYVSDSLNYQQVFIGLPDNYKGAFIFRNGFNEALKLNYPKYEPSRWLMPIRSYFFGQAIVWQKNGDTIKGDGTDLTFTLTNNSDYFEHRLLQPTIIEDRYHFILGQGYEITPNLRFKAVEKKSPVQFFVFDENGLVLLKTKTVN